MTYSPRQPRIFMDESRDLSKYLSIDFCLDEHSRALWLGENKTPLSMSKTSVNIEGDFNVSGNIVSHNGSITDGSGNVLGSGGGASALNDLSDVSYSSGDLTITSLDKIVASGSLTLDTATFIELNTDTGTVKFKDDTVDMAQFRQGLLELYSTDVNDYMRMATGTNGATTVYTIDDSGGNNANFTLDISGDICLDSANGNFLAKNNGTEFSVANSAYAGMILGYTCLRNDGSTGDSITIGTSMTVLQTSAGNDVKVTFKAPPSGNVEIEFSACVRGTSKSVRCALSDNATFNEVADFHTYDNKCITMDETDAYYNNIKWFVSGLTAGDEYTYFIGAKSSSASSFIDHGENRFALHSAPIIVKCTALPGTIFTGE